MPEFPYKLERIVVIRATPEIVYGFFTDSARWATWWGAGSTIEGTPGGKVHIRHSNGVEVLGEVLEAEPLRRIVFTYGYASGNPIPPGASLVTILLEAHPDGTRLHLTHEFEEPEPRDLHIQGWRFQLSLFGNVTASEAFAGAQAAVDSWFAAWQMADGAARDAELARIATPEIRFRDRYSLLEGREDLSAHISAALRFLPGIGLRRKGEVRHCQGTVLADWAAAGADGVERMSGTSVFLMHPDGRIASVTGVTNA
jgi:uncharacterized protein YndB with AHSA1/START domain